MYKYPLKTHDFSIKKKYMDLSLGLNSTGSGIPPDFAFAFNDINFSDRVLRIEILPDFSTGSTRTRKPSRSEETVQKENDADVVMQRGEQIPNYILLDSEDDLDDENQDEEAVRMLDESPSGVEMTANPSGDDEAAIGGDSPTNMESSNPLRVRIIHISSPILAAKSPFFYKLFSNGMKESEQRHATIRINESEEAALVDLLNFMYSNTLATTTPDGLLDVLMAADKFEVVSCMRYCSCLLQNLRMTCESALLYLDLPSSVLTADAVLPLTDAAKQFLAAHFQDITKFEQEALNLPLAGVEAVLSSDDLQIASEDAVCDFVLKWARIHYPKLDERREVLGSRLCHLIRFPCMTCRKLKKVLTWNDFDPELASKLVLEALFYKAGVKSKAEAPYRQRDLAAEHTNALCHRYVDRAYKYKPVKIVEFEIPYQQCVVYLDLKREELANLFPAGRVYSQAFHLGGQGFFLSAHCNLDQQNTFHCFGLFLGMQERGSVSFAVDYEFAARTKPSEEYVNRYKGVYMFTGGKAVGYRNLFGISWNSFIAEDSVYFINGILHLRAELTIRQ